MTTQSRSTSPRTLRSHFGVSVCGGKYEQQGVARPHHLLADGDVLPDLAPDELVRAHQAEELLDRCRPAGRVSRQLCADVWKLH